MPFWKSWFNKRIDFIQDILRSDGDVFQLIAAIPSELKKKAISAEVPSHEQLLNSTTVSCHRNVHPYIDLPNMRSKHYYKMFNKNCTLEPTGIKNWKIIFAEEHSVWKNRFLFIYHSTRDKN